MALEGHQLSRSGVQVDVRSLGDLRQLPYSTRLQLVHQQTLDPPYAMRRTNSAFVRVSQSRATSGPPLCWLDTLEDLERRSHAWQTVLADGGVLSTDRVLHGLSPASATARDCWSAALALGTLSIGSDDPSLDHLLRHAPTVLIGAPGDALRIAQQAASRHVDLGAAAVRLVVVTGAPGGSISSIRRRIEDRFGARCLDVYALTEAGVLGWACAAAGNHVHFNEDDFLFETIEPDSDQPAQDGHPGELVVTALNQQGSQLVRYRTGDLVLLSREQCSCGHGSAFAIGGVLGRVEERMVVRGVTLLPSSVEQVVWRHPAVAAYRLLVFQTGNNDDCELGVQLETDDAIASESDRSRVAAEVSEDLRRSLGLRLACDVVASGGHTGQAAGRRARRLRRQ